MTKTDNHGGDIWRRAGDNEPASVSRFRHVDAYSLADYPRVYAEFIEERNLNRVVLVGNSIGGLMVQLTMQPIPHRIVHGIWYMIMND
jgi:pimeloyl-ACP methyl ester carboxylesterase